MERENNKSMVRANEILKLANSIFLQAKLDPR